jgi:hypothetical protein
MSILHPSLTEPTQKHNDMPGDPPCSFCKSGRDVVTYIFTNPAHDCFICNVCVAHLLDTMLGVAALEGMPEGQKAN